MRLTTLRWALAALLLLSAVAWTLVRRLGVLPPAAVAILAAGAVVVAAILLGADLRRAVTERRIRSAASALVFGGIALGGGVGLYGWARSIQGYVLLAEGEPLPVESVETLQRHWGGPLGSVAEIEGSLVLDRLELEPIGEGFMPLSRVTHRGTGGGTESFLVSSGKPAIVGGLHLYQGAFGFAPRITVARQGRTLFDEYVPFRTRLLQDRAVAFDGEVELEQEGIRIVGEVDISTLDQRMRGHPGLVLQTTRGGKEIGSGALTPGHSAEVEGYRIGYAGMRRWTEIDVRRGGYARWVRAGILAVALGALLWALAAWRQW